MDDLDLSHLGKRTHEPISTDCEEAENEIRRLRDQLVIATQTLEYIRLQVDRGEKSPTLLAAYANDGLIHMSVVE